MKNIILKGISYFNGISFKNQTTCTRAIVKKDGTYTIIKSNSLIHDFSEKIILGFHLISSIFIMLFSILKIKNIEIILGNFIFCIFFYLPSILTIYAILCSILKPEVRKYHTAEHKILNFFTKHNRFPTLKEIKKVKEESRFCTDCSSVNSTRKSLSGIIWMILLYSNLEFLNKIIIFSIAYLVFHLIAKINILLYLQFITTSPKNCDAHILIGISTLQELQESKSQ